MWLAPQGGAGKTDTTSIQPGIFLWAMMPSATFRCGASMPAATFMASTGLFELRVRSLGGLPPGSQRGRAPTLRSLCGGASCALLPLLGPPCSSASCLHLWSLGNFSSAPSSHHRASPCSRMGSHLPLFRGRLRFHGSASALHLPFCGNALCGGTSTSCLCLALSCAQGTNALGLATMAFSASLAGSMLVIPLARAGVAPTMGDTPPCLCALTHKGLTFWRSTFIIATASLRGSWPSRITGALPNVDNTPPASCRSSACGSGGFQSSGR